jgi:hypothetical protein
MLVDGEVSARLVLNPRAGYDKEPVKKLHRQDDGTWTMTSGPAFMRLSGGGQAQAGWGRRHHPAVERARCRGLGARAQTMVTFCARMRRRSAGSCVSTRRTSGSGRPMDGPVRDRVGRGLRDRGASVWALEAGRRRRSR